MDLTKKLILDHNLYIFNQSSRAFWVQHGVSEMTAPLELNARELGNLGLTNMELPVYGYLPVMISAQCIQNYCSWMHAHCRSYDVVRPQRTFSAGEELL